MARRLVRSEIDCVIGGVCGGLAEYINIDATLVRVIFVILALCGIGAPILIYLVMWMLLPTY